ncbi:MAG: rod shape-determining protein RodA [Candidatus Margulisiibacteriota bacterium]
MLRIFKRLDISLLIAVGVLLFISIFMILSASTVQLENRQEAVLNVLKHLFACSVGTLFFLFFLSINYKILNRYWWVLYAGMIGLLVYVLHFGHTSQGAQRWVNLGFFVFQPSEAAKLIVIISLAAVLSRQKSIDSFKKLLPSMVLVGIPFILVAKQPDLGTALVFIFVLFGMLVMARATGKLLFLLSSPFISLGLYYLFPQGYHVIWILYIIGLFAYLASKKTPLVDTFLCLLMNVCIVWVAPFFWQLLKPYQQERLMVFIKTDIDPMAQGIRYHIDKSVTAVGSGGFWGQGWLNGALSHLQYIPVRNSDFIFSVIAEEFGFIGSSLVLFLLGTVILRGMKIASQANDFFGSLLAAGISSFFLFQVFVNIGMTIGIMPVVGIPLPFLSFGGSALVTDLCAIGLLGSIIYRRNKLFF